MLNNNYEVINTRFFLEKDNKSINENILKEIISEFSCPLNTEVENFLKNNSIEFTKKHQSVTYLVLSETDADLLGYFTLTIKPIEVNVDILNSEIRRKILRVTSFDTENNSYSLSAYLIAQLGKNYFFGLNDRITGTQLLKLALQQIKFMQYWIGGVAVFLETSPNKKLLKFYDDNKFKPFGVRMTKATQKNKSEELIQLLRIL